MEIELKGTYFAENFRADFLVVCGRVVCSLLVVVVVQVTLKGRNFVGWWGGERIEECEE